MAGRKALGFWSSVGGVMALLKLKEQWDQSDKRVDTDDEEGRVALHSPSAYHQEGDEEARVALLDTEIVVPKPTKRRSGCCVCCGIDCTLFWKAFGIVCLLFTIYGAAKLLFWVFSPSPTGLEGMPAYSSSLGCLDAPHYYNGSQLEVLTPIGSSKQEHLFDVTGSGVGTFVLAQGEPDATDIKYKFSLRTNDQSLLESVSIQLPDIENNRVVRSQLVIHTPHIPADSHSCIRYDVTAYIPPNLKTLHVSAHAPAHVKMEEDVDITLDKLFVTLYALNDKNLILSSVNIRAAVLALEVFRGWIVGDTSIVRETSINTQRGDGVANVHVHPAPSANSNEPEPAVLRTATGSGRTDIFYVTPKAYKRPIDSSHISARNGDVYLTYKESEFTGKIEFESKSYSMSGTQSLANPDGPWNYFVREEDGADKMTVSSRGWTGLYF
ncbi:hypothetical protein BDQ17DRAFT_1234159 [Cyathus striatus]|nr:hypothetical protein BDQ17DRAFT_1234159 [Cyathus striatus]